MVGKLRDPHQLREEWNTRTQSGLEDSYIQFLQSITRGPTGQIVPIFRDPHLGRPQNDFGQQGEKRQEVEFAETQLAHLLGRI